MMGKTAYYTLGEIAARMGCSKRTIRRYIKQHQFPAARIGRELFITEKSLQKWEEALESRNRVKSL